MNSFGSESGVTSFRKRTWLRLGTTLGDFLQRLKTLLAVSLGLLLWKVIPLTFFSKG